jgi:hypothetical protein
MFYFERAQTNSTQGCTSSGGALLRTVLERGYP